MRLPRTRLGKIQRHRLAQRFETAKRGDEKIVEVGPMAVEEMSGEDRALLEDAAAQSCWELLARRYPGKRLTPDTSLQFDLAVDSLEWLNLTLEIAESSGVEVTEEAIARIDTVRDLLREVIEASEGQGIDPLAQPYEILDPNQKRWLEPLGPVVNLTARFLYAFGRVLDAPALSGARRRTGESAERQAMGANAESCQLSRSFRGRGRARLAATAPDLLGGLDRHCLGKRHHAFLEPAGKDFAGRTDTRGSDRSGARRRHSAKEKESRLVPGRRTFAHGEAANIQARHRHVARTLSDGRHTGVR